MNTISAVSQNAAQYNNSVLNVVETANNTDFSNPTDLAKTATVRTQDEVKEQLAVTAFNAEKDSQSHVLDLYA